jgi:hypothetical protein
MKKGIEWPINLLGAVILLIIAVGLWWSALSLDRGIESENPVDEAICRTPKDCASNVDGSKCLVIYADYVTPFCGCLTSDDCMEGYYCGSNNKCV